MRTASAVILTGVLLWAAPTALARGANMAGSPRNSAGPVSTEPHQAGDEGLTFWQLDLDFDEGFVSHSDWGAVDLEFTGEAELLYFSLVVNDSLRIQNVPVFSVGAPGTRQVMTYYFSLGVSPGTPVEEITYGYDLTAAPQSEEPTGQNWAAVGQQLMTMGSGEVDEQIGPSAPLSCLVGGLVQAYAGHPVAPPFPNQECGMNECVPAAISNNLLWLNDLFQMGIGAGFLSIDAMKLATGWTGWGAPTTPNPWWHRKDVYMGEHLPIRTGYTVPFMSLDWVMPYMDTCGVEIRIPGHVAAAIAMGKFFNGNYWMVVVHDTKQAQPGGTVTETVFCDGSSFLLTGAPAFNNQYLALLVVQCFDPDLRPCCLEDDSCVMTTSAGCPGAWGPPGVPSCDPNPCPWTGSEPTTWGRIKSIYR